MTCSPGEEKAFEVPVEIAAPYQPGSTRRVTVTLENEAGLVSRVQAEADITVAEPGWTMWMVSHFHYDPVWWNTQGQFTEARLSLPDEDGRLPDVRSAFELVGAHLDKARKDADYKFVLAEIDYLKPYFDAFPQDRQDLRRLMAEGRVEIVGGNYNEPSTNLICAEAIIRNAVYGIGFQRDVFGGDPRSAWMLDVFGHDPGYPGLMAAAGLTSSAWARGPFHQWGPSGAEGGDRRMQFSTEFEWISPDGHGLLTAYMAHHYGAGWRLHTLPDLQAAELEAYGQFRGLAQVATTRNVLLPVGSDHVIPARWVTDIHRDWNRRYVWPRFTTAVPREFFDAVRAEASSGGRAGAWITPQTRDMNPVYTGKDVSYIDTKQAQRAIETVVTEAERLGTLAWRAGAPYPHAALDKAWRLLAYGAHHDGITGVESDRCTCGRVRRPEACNDEQMRIVSVESTDLFVGTAQRPLQVVRVTLVNEEPGAASARLGVQGAGVRDPGPFGINDLNPGEEKAFEAPWRSPRRTSRAARGGSRSPSRAEAGRRIQAEADITVAEPGWTMWMVSHFHYDPVWWNTQGQFTEARLSLPDEDGRLPDVRSAFELVGAHLDKARKDPDYKFVLAEIDYLKPYFDAFPQDRQDLRRLMAEGRVEIVGGNYNEPNTNLISAEAIIRNAVYGIGFQRDVFGGDPRSAWMLDAFGHDPGYPGLMAAAGLTSSAWARGPFHQWGPSGAEGGDRRMQFGTEFEWISPDGRGLLTAYMAHHYGAGWRLHTLPDLQAAELEAYGQFRGLAQVATTRNVLLPVGADHVIPARWVTDIHRDWNQRYVWPRFTTAVPREFFDAVRAEASSGGHAGAWITPQTRDMNPVYTGKDVSYIDTKQAQRAIETAVTEAERLGTLAWRAGAPYPHAALDAAWRLLAYGAHHDGITGVESDQVYLDLLGGWREAWELGSAARRDAVAALAGPTGPGLGVSVFNALARPRGGVARVTVQVPDDGTRWLEVRDGAGQPVRALAEGVRRRPDGSLAEMTLTLAVADVPALGSLSYRLVPADPSSEWTGEWRQDAFAAENTIENGRYAVTADPARGGTVSMTDKRTRASVLAGPGNELVIQDEYAQHPRHGEGPWHLSPKGPGLGSVSVPATVRQERCPIGSRLVASFALDGLDVNTETVLWENAERVEFRTHVDSYRGRDRLLRVRFPADVPGGLPVYQTATAVVGRSFGVVDVDSADHWYTLDNPAHQWFGVGSTARVRTGGRNGLTQAIGVAEVVCPLLPNDLRDTLRELLVALAAAGVTATCSQADGSRYGGIDADSNLPDVRIAVGGPEVNPFTAEVLAAAGPGYAKALAARLDAGSGRHGCGCRPRGTGRTRSGRTPTCAGPATCRC